MGFRLSGAAGILAASFAVGGSVGCDGANPKDAQTFIDRNAPRGGSTGGGDATNTSDPKRLVGDRRIAYEPPDDTAFIDFFIPHHRNAIRLADAEIAQGAREEIRALAQRMKTDQAGEIEMMRQARQELSGQPEPPAPPADPHMEADVITMQQGSGGDVDRMFLEHMIPHHAAGLPVAHRADINLEREDIHFFSQHFFDEQASDIGMMKQLLGAPTVCPFGGELAGCTTAADVAVVGDRRTPFTPSDDVAFIDFFIAHHAMAIDMAQREVEAGARAEVRALAQKIIDAQTAEIARMKESRQAIAGSPEPNPQPEDPHATKDLALMQRLVAGALDDRFLRDMIQHHAAGLPPAHRPQPRLQNDDLRAIARNILASQAQEIGEMQRLRCQ